MSKIRKARRLRTPNVPLATEPTSALTTSEPTGAAPVRPAGRAATPEAPSADFDYTVTRNDLKRIGLIAATFLVVLVALSFFIR